jgi:hypothetical protein
LSIWLKKARKDRKPELEVVTEMGTALPEGPAEKHDQIGIYVFGRQRKVIICGSVWLGLNTSCPGNGDPEFVFVGAIEKNSM